MDKKLEEFLKKGYSSYYLKSLETAGYFQQMMGEKLLNIVRKEVKWSTFSPAKGDSSRLSFYDKNKCISAYIEGTMAGKKAEIDTGIWWESPVKRCPLIAYAGFLEPSPKHLVNFQYRSQNGRISSFSYYGTTKLYVPDPDFDTLSGELILLLEELQGQATSEGG